MGLIEEIKAWFVNASGTQQRLRVEVSNDDPIGVGINPSDIGLTTIKTDLGVSQFEIVPVSNQQSITITNLDNIKVHYSLSTGVLTSHAFIKKGDQLVLENYAGSVFVLRASGTGSIQIDQESST